MTRALRLELGPQTLDFADFPTHGVIVSTVDLGYPAVREVLTDLPTQDGSFDQTAYIGPRVVTITGNLGPGSAGTLSSGRSALAPFLAPSARPQLVVALDDESPEITFTGRGADFTSIVASGSTANFTASWTCADPVGYGQATNEIDIRPATAGSSGRTYPRTYPLTYPITFGGGGTAYITTQGNYQAWPVLRIDGPVKNPTVTWLDPVTRTPTGTQVVLAGLKVASGDYLEIDTKAKTVLLNGDPGSSRYSFLDFEATTWGPLTAGTNLLRFTSPSAPPPALARVFWSDCYLI